MTLLDGGGGGDKHFYASGLCGRKQGARMSGAQQPRNCLPHTSHLQLPEDFFVPAFRLFQEGMQEEMGCCSFCDVVLVGGPCGQGLGSEDHLSPRLGSGSGIQRLLKGVVHTSSRSCAESEDTGEGFTLPRALPRKQRYWISSVRGAK